MNSGKIFKDNMELMKDTNKRQASFYDDHYINKGNPKQNLIMKVWLRFRLRLKKYKKNDHKSISLQIKSLHRDWMEENDHKIILDIGCGPGSSFSMWLAKISKHYIGIELSSKAAAKFKDTLDKENLISAEVLQMDFLENSFPDNYFDIIYISAVLHHFSDTEVLCKEIYRVLKPGGIIVSSDPLKTNMITKNIRKIYRLFQSNKEWEWPFTKSTFGILEKYFVLEEIRGFLGMSLFGFLISFVPGLTQLANYLYDTGNKYDRKYASRKCTALWRCHVVVLLMRKHV